MSFITDFKESNRWKHFICAIPIGMEFKDNQYGNLWDWKDFGFTMLGGLIGQIIQIIILVILL